MMGFHRRGSKNKVLSVLMRGVPQKNGADTVLYGVVPLI